MSTPGPAARRERIYDAHYADVLGFALRRAPRPVADDVVAETFLVAWRRLEDVPRDTAPWLYGVARRVMANERRASGRRAALVERLRAAPAPAATGVMGQRLSEAIGRLPERDREALALVAWEELTAAQAARVVGCSHAAMRVRLHRARARLARALDDLGVESRRPPESTEEAIA